MIQNFSFLEISEQETKIIQDREHYLFSVYFEANKDMPEINLSHYKQNIPNNVDIDKLENYNKRLLDIQENRRNKMIKEIQNQLKIIEELNYKFIDNDIKTVSKLCLRDFGIMSRFPYMESDSFQTFLVYDLSDYNNNLKFKHRGEINEPDDIIPVTEINRYNKNDIFIIKNALNKIYFMIRNFKKVY